MFSFIKKYAETLNGAEVYPKIAMLLFLIVFISMVWFALRADKGYIKELTELPLTRVKRLNKTINLIDHDAII